MEDVNVRVIGYTKVIPPGKALKPSKPNHKLDIIKNFIEGVRTVSYTHLTLSTKRIV